MGTQRSFVRQHISRVIPVVIALDFWPKYFINNQAAVTIPNKMSSKSYRVMGLVWKLVLVLLPINIPLKTRRLSSAINSISVALSCCNFQKFRELAPLADVDPEPIPYSLENLAEDTHSSISNSLAYNTMISYDVTAAFLRNLQSNMVFP